MEREAAGRVGGLELHFEHRKFNTRHTSGDVRKAVGYASLGLKGDL